MQISDVIADMLTRIRNAGSARHETVDIPASNLKKSIADILLREGYISDVKVLDEGVQGVIRITLKYNSDKRNAIKGIKRISKPGLRVYAGKDDIPKVLGGLGT
ncbi:MAG TPA: 30S ribosomal protein S8, partial [Clostridia bacterium]|nr:30S ribosomal protein S8 [Clostridia bacterium]